MSFKNKVVLYRKTSLMFFLMLLTASTVLAEDGFDWSFNEKKDAESKEAAADSSGEFKWNVGDDKAKHASPASTPSAPVRKPAKPASSSGIDATAYNELLRENIQLRKDIETVKSAEKTHEQQKLQLKNEINDMSRRMANMASEINLMKKERARSSVASSRLSALERDLQLVTDEKNRLALTVSELKKAGAPGTSANVDMASITSSDLYRELEQANAELKAKLARIQDERDRAVKTSGKVEEKSAKSDQEKAQLKSDLAEAKKNAQRYRKNLEGVLAKLPSMESELETLRRRAKAEDAIEERRSTDMQVMSLELQRRQHRLDHAERVVSLLEKTRSEVKSQSQKEKRDMHYNMALVYVRDNRPQDAEREYLNALKIDPSDADVHYNLGILYDDALNEKKKAALHYRRYIKLRPDAKDLENVKSWLIACDMQK